MRSRKRAQSGPVRVHFVASLGTGEGIAVAYSVPRRVGGAVVRNRCRRRMRAVAAQVARELPSGSYLVSVGEDVLGLSFVELQRRLVEAMRTASGSK